MAGDVDPGAYHDRIALLLQGGGALGTYQLGVYEALSEAGYEPDWVSGTSIGAIQSAIIAGNPPQRRLERLHEFWDRIAWPQFWPAPPADHPLRKPVNVAYALMAAAFGQPGFYRPGSPLAWMGVGEHQANGLYDHGPLRDTLSELVDFDLLNNGPIRVSLGVVDVNSGVHRFFDSRDEPLDVRHIMASSSMPPALPSVEIDGRHYWDGGILSNTPLDAVLGDEPRRSTLCFMVDVYDREGQPPNGLDEVSERQKEINLASRSDEQIEQYSELYNLRRAVAELYERLPDADKRDPDVDALRKLGCTTTTNIVHFIYGGQAYRSWTREFTFMPQTLEDHRRAGYANGVATLANRPWENPAPPHLGIRVYEAEYGKAHEI